MCTLIFAHRPAARFPLVIAANRDEMYERPTAPAAFWDDAPDLLAGRDIRAGGTWLGITRGGRWAAVTNIYDPDEPADALSRGELVTEFLTAAASPADYLANIRARADRYRGFNLLVGDLRRLGYLSNRDGPVRAIEPGVHAVCNDLIGAPWHKTERGIAHMRAALAGDDGADGAALIASLHEGLGDRTPAPDRELVREDISLASRRARSALFVADEDFGTCCSTAVVVAADGRAWFEERTTNPRAQSHRAAYAFTVAAP